MILDHLDNCDQYRRLHPLFDRAMNFLRRPDMAELKHGRHDIVGEQLFALVSVGVGKGKTPARLEAHRKYIDVQFTLSGEELIGWRPTGLCKNASEPYEAAKDIEFFADRPFLWAQVPASCFAVFFPQDAHAPLAGEGPIHKVVVKLAV